MKPLLTRVPLAALLLVASAPAHAQAARVVSFTKDVLPIFQTHCTMCHGVDQKGGLKLDSYDNILQGGTRGMDIVKGQPAQSLLVKMVEGLAQPRMPMGSPPLTRFEQLTIRNWVQQGAKDDTNSVGGGTGNAEKPLTIAQPKDGSTVRERVRIVVPRTSIPPDGFVSVYIDRHFQAAIAPKSPEELKEQKLPAGAPLMYLWDTNAPLIQDTTLPEAQRIPQDGDHLIQVISYRSDGSEAERVVSTVHLKNRIDTPANQPVPLWYGGTLGRQYIMEHVVDLTAEAATTTANPTPDSKFTHLETTRYLVSLEDFDNGTGSMFWRERMESPITIVVNGEKQIVQIDPSSDYFAMDRRGTAQLSEKMRNEKRTPILNPVELPGREHRLGEPFLSTLRINMGAYIPATVQIDHIDAIAEGLEWQFGEPCVRVRLTYSAGTSKLSVPDAGIEDGDFTIDGNSTSTIWFSEKTHRVLRTEHNISGSLVVDASKVGGGGFARAGMGGPGASGMAMGMGGPYGGGMSSGGMSSGGPPPGFGGMMGSGGMRGMPFGGSGGMSSGGMPGMPFGGPGGNMSSGGMSSGGPPPGFGGMMGSGGMRGMPFGGSGGMSSGGPYGGSSGMMGGGMGMGIPNPNATGGLAPTTIRYHVTLKVASKLVPGG